MNCLVDRKSLRLSLALLQASPFCNIDCKYCYLPERSSTRRMSPEILRKSLEFLMGEKPGLLDPQASLVFHCGEPLSVPIEFYRSAFDQLEQMNVGRPPITVRFSTNGTRIDQEWCDLIRARGYIKMRVSIDGPRWLHDSNRVTRQGKGTFDEVMRGINLLQSNGIPFDALCVLTHQSLQVPGELWEFFSGLGARGVGFCVEEILGVHTSSSLQFAAAYEQMKVFFSTWLRQRNSEKPSLYVRELDDLLELFPKLDGLQGFHMRPDNIPFSAVTISWDGDICLFSPELLTLKNLTYGDFILGNVTTHTVDDILASRKFALIYKDILAGVLRCKQDCAYFDRCGGGFPISKLLENGTFRSSETLTCRMRVQAIMDVVLEHTNRGVRPRPYTAVREPFHVAAN